MPEANLSAHTPEPALHGAKGSLNRRRALRVIAALTGLPLMIAGVRATAPKGQFVRWQGEVLGAISEISLWHADARFARATLWKVRQEIDLLERIYSLYRPDSEISRLNKDGRLSNPSPEFRRLIEESQRLSVLSRGAFDISVQPLWRLYEAHFWTRTGAKSDIGAKARDTARSLVDFRQIDSGASTIKFAREGMAITLNSIAQGAVTDAITDILRHEGFGSAVVDLGEFRTLGQHPDGHPWRIGIGRSANPGTADEIVDLDNMALAVSSGLGTTFETSGRFHHIFDPRTGASANELTKVAVIAPSAMVADGLATAICVAGEAKAQGLLAAYPGSRAILTRTDGAHATYSSHARSRA